MSSAKRLRTLAVAALAVVLIAGGCNRGNNEPEEADVDVTDAPERTPTTEALADFQLVGRIDEAFRGQEPEVDITDVEPDPDATAAPAASPVGGTSTVGGIIRIEVEDASDDLTDACGIDTDDVVELFWTPATFFEPDDVLDDIEDEIEDRTAGILGKVYRSSEAAEDEDDDNFLAQDSPAPDTTDDAAAGTASPDAVEEATDCILVAEQIGFTNTATLPTPRPVARRTAAPVRTPVRTRTPTARPTSTPQRTPTTAPATSAPALSPSPAAT